jgi:hypothetical protein
VASEIEIDGTPYWEASLQLVAGKLQKYNFFYNFRGMTAPDGNG